MQKGPRFIWYNWSKATSAGQHKTENESVFDGSIHAFGYLAVNIVHQRKVSIDKSKHIWQVEDHILNYEHGPFVQRWHIPQELDYLVKIERAGRCRDGNR